MAQYKVTSLPELIGILTAVLLIGLVKVWLVGSVIVSGIKAVSQSCGQHYRVEAVFSGDWLCPSTGDK